jgi:hypothetical protein
MKKLTPIARRLAALVTIACTMVGIHGGLSGPPARGRHQPGEFSSIDWGVADKYIVSRCVVAREFQNRCESCSLAATAGSSGKQSS